MQQVLRPGDTFFDVGAHIGTETLFAARLVGERGRVCSFEPAPWTLPRLVRHIELNGAKNVTVLNVAVGAEAGPVLIKRAVGNDGRSRLGEMVDAVSAVATCQVVTLDDAWKAMGRPAVRMIKIDVEGHEPSVLRGATELLDRVSHLLVEAAWDVEYRAKASGELLETLRAGGWTIRHWNGETWEDGAPTGVVECDIWATREANGEELRIPNAAG
jgi:FkbM family methyltransferase